MPDRPHPNVSRPVNWMRWIAVITSVLGGFTLLSIVWPYLLPLIQNRNLWAAISLILILLFTSGHMFNHIRKVPYVSGDGRGGISYFAGGFSNQFGLETQIIAGICKYFHVRLVTLPLTMSRRIPLLCNYCIGPESAAHLRPEDTASFSPHLGRCNLLHVWFPAQCLPDQKWRLSFLATAILVDETIGRRLK